MNEGFNCNDCTHFTIVEYGEGGMYAACTKNRGLVMINGQSPERCDSFVENLHIDPYEDLFCHLRANVTMTEEELAREMARDREGDMVCPHGWWGDDVVTWT